MLESSGGAFTLLLSGVKAVVLKVKPSCVLVCCYRMSSCNYHHTA